MRATVCASQATSETGSETRGGVRASVVGCLLAVVAVSPALPGSDLAPGGVIVLSEIQYNPPAALGGDELYEYVELHNRSTSAVDVSGWRLKDRDDDHTFTIPAGTSIPAGGELVVARDAVAMRGTYGDDLAVVGDRGFALGKGGDTVGRRDARGEFVERVEYDADLPGPAAADGGGPSLERVSIEDDITDFTNFLPGPSGARPGTPGAANARSGEIAPRHDVVFNEIQFHPVADPQAESLQHCSADEFLELHNRGPASVDISGWRIVEGVDFVFAEGTVLAAGGYLALYPDEDAFRDAYGELADAVGPYTLQLDDGGEELLLVDVEGSPVDRVRYDDTLPWPVNPDGLRGSLELVDAFGDNDRGQAWRQSEGFRGTPGARNSATEGLDATGNSAPPQVTGARARPVLDRERETIRSTDEVEVKVRVRDHDGVAAVRLEYQAVLPGDYISRTDPRFASRWTSVAMSWNGDRVSYTAVLPAFPHRTLVRYRIHAVDAAASPAQSRAPYPSDPVPNFAYFVHDGVPDYVASRRSGFGDLGFVHGDLEKVPVYHVLMDGDDLDEMLYVERDARDNTYSWSATFVHENRVHDHCGARLRGSSQSRYGAAKRSWKLRFPKGARFRGRYNDGTRYPNRRSVVNLNRGVAGGIVEKLSHELHHDSGALSPIVTLVHVRMITSEDEHEQFDGDFFGLFAEVQAIDKVLLRDGDRSLAEASSLYKLKGFPNKKHSDCDPSVEDYREFRADSLLHNDREWFQENLHLHRYYSFRSAMQLTNNHDQDSEKNLGYYLDSEAGLWEPIPWDVECSFRLDPCSGEEPLALKIPRLFRVEYRNRFRHIWQLQLSEGRLLRRFEEVGELVREVADADVDRWSREPRLACPPCEDGTYVASPFEGRVRWVGEFLLDRVAVAVPELADSEVPRTPTNAFPAAGSSVAPIVRLRTHPFLDHEDDDHVATRWLLIAAGGDWVHPLWETELRVDLQAGDLEEVAVPVEVTAAAGTYLFRAAHQDSRGRWSFFSEPTAFSVGAADATPPTAPVGLAVLAVTSRSVTLSWDPSEDPETAVAGYRVLRDGVSLEAALVAGDVYHDFGVRAAGRHEYRVVAVNGAGLESGPSSTALATIPSATLGGWRVPAGGLAYLYDARPRDDFFHDRQRYPGVAPRYLDGRWTQASWSQWDGSRPAEEGAAPGGLAIEVIAGAGTDGGVVSALSLEDPGAPGDPDGIAGPDNSALYFLHDIGPDSVLESGVTLVARLRIHPSPVDLPAARGQAPQSPDLQGQIGVGFGGRGSPRGHLDLWLDDGALHTVGGHSVGLDATEFQSLWLTLEPEADRHRVRVWVGGSTEPSIDAAVALTTQGVERRSRSSYIAMGLSNTAESGAIQIDWVGYLRGAVAPRSGSSEDADFIRGDTDGDGVVHLTDAVLTLGWLFRGARDPGCLDAADTDDSGRVDITDAIATLEHLFLGGPAPAAPFPDCGADGATDELAGCASVACP